MIVTSLTSCLCNMALLRTQKSSISRMWIREWIWSLHMWSRPRKKFTVSWKFTHSLSCPRGELWVGMAL